MARNLTSRMTQVNINIRDEGLSQFVFQTKEALMAFLYATAVENWNVNGQIPSSRKGAIDGFYNNKSGNSFNCQIVTFVSNDGADRSARASEQFVDRIRGRNQQKPAKVAGRSR